MSSGVARGIDLVAASATLVAGVLVAGGLALANNALLDHQGTVGARL